MKRASAERRRYFQGQRDGASTEYSSSGEVIALGQYSDGEKNGQWNIKRER